MAIEVGSAEGFVGRQMELGRLRARLTAAVGGRGSLVLVAGEAGVGKTALVQQFAADAQASGALVLWAACYEGEWRPPYAPWADTLGQLLAGLNDPGLQRHLGGHASPLA